MQGHLSENVKTQIAITNANGAAGTSDINGEEIDLEGYNSVRFCVMFGAIVSGAATSVKGQQDSATGMAGASDLEGTSITVADTDDNKIVILDIVGVRKQFFRGVVLRATQNATVDLAWYEAYNATELPVTQHADVTTLEKHVEPAEGTA